MYNKTLAVVKVILLFTKHKQKNVYLIGILSKSTRVQNPSDFSFNK